MVKAKDLRAQSTTELEAQARDLRKQIFDLRCSLASKKEDVKASEITSKKRDIARCLTILSDRQRQQTERQ